MLEPSDIVSEAQRKLRDLQNGAEADLEALRPLAVDVVQEIYGAYMFPAIRKLPLDQPILEKTNLDEMGCDGGFDPIPPQQIEYDARLTSAERFVALIRAAIQFYAYSGKAEIPFGDRQYTRWGFLHLDQSGAPNTKYLGLFQDMVRYLTDEICTQHLQTDAQTWMQRGNSQHIAQLVARSSRMRDLLLQAYFGEAFPALYDAINANDPNRFERIADLSDQIDNAVLCDFSPDYIGKLEEAFTREVQSLNI